MPILAAVGSILDSAAALAIPNIQHWSTRIARNRSMPSLSWIAYLSLNPRSEGTWHFSLRICLSYSGELTEGLERILGNVVDVEWASEGIYDELLWNEGELCALRDKQHRLLLLRSKLPSGISELNKNIYGHISLWQGSKCMATSKIIAPVLYAHMKHGKMKILCISLQAFLISVMRGKLQKVLVQLLHAIGKYNTGTILKQAHSS